MGQPGQRLKRQRLGPQFPTQPQRCLIGGLRPLSVGEVSEDVSQLGEGRPLDTTRTQGNRQFQGCLGVLAGCLVVATLVAE